MPSSFVARNSWVRCGFPGPIPDVEALVRELKLHRHAPLDFRPRGAHGPAHMSGRTPFSPQQHQNP